MVTKSYRGVTAEVVNAFLEELLGRKVTVSEISSKPTHNQVFNIASAGLIFKVFHGDGHRRYTSELLSLQLLKAKGVKVPAVIHYGDDLHGASWILEERVDGLGLDGFFSQLSLNHRVGLIGKIVNLLVQMQQVEISSALKLGHRPLEVRAARLVVSRTRAPQNQRRLLDQALRLINDLVRQCKSRPQVLVHRDYSLRNVMAVMHRDGGIEISGVIDFEHAYLGDQMDDVATFILRDLWQMAHLRKAFLKDYGALSLSKTACTAALTACVLLNAGQVLTWANDVDQSYFKLAERVCGDLIENPSMLG